MLNIFTLFPLLLLIITSYYFNHKKLITTKRHIIVISIFEGIFSYFIFFLLFLEGFITMFLHLIVIFVVMLIFGYVTTVLVKDLDENWDLQIETIKNNLVVSTLTILQFYVLLTIFRFQNLYLQILFAFFVTAALFWLSLKAKKCLTPIYEKIYAFINEFYATKYIFLFISICLIIVAFELFDLPTNKVSNHINLSNNVNYLKFDGFPTNIKNNFREKEIIKIDLEDLIVSRVSDYYYDETYLYLYTENETLLTYNLSDNEVVNIDTLGTNTPNVINTEIYNKFTYYNNYLILLGCTGTYMVTPDISTKISDNSYLNTSKFYHENELYFLKKHTDTLYKIYKFTEGNLTLTETINIAELNYSNLLVISDKLFYEDNNNLVLYYDPSISIERRDGFAIYDDNRQIMYFTLTNKYPRYILHDTKYQKVEANGETSEIRVYKSHNSKGIIINDFIYFTELEDDINRIEIMNSDFELTAIYNHLVLQPFWISNHYNISYIGNYQEKDNNLEFLQVDKNDKHTIISIQQLQEKDVDLDIPFYTHYGIGIFIPIIIAFFIPITNYRESQTTISFETATKKKKE